MIVRVGYTPIPLNLFVLQLILKVILLKEAGFIVLVIYSKELILSPLGLSSSIFPQPISCFMFFVPFQIFLSLYISYQEKIRFSHLEASLFYPLEQSWEIETHHLDILIGNQEGNCQISCHCRFLFKCNLNSKKKGLPDLCKINNVQNPLRNSSVFM